MKRVTLILLLCSTVGDSAQVSYWWSQELKKPDAKQSQEFFFIPGIGIYFTYTNNRVVINTTNTGGGFAGLTTNICVRFCDGTDRTLTFTNGLLAGVSPPPAQSFLIQPAGLGYLLCQWAANRA